MYRLKKVFMVVMCWVLLFSTVGGINPGVANASEPVNINTLYPHLTWNGTLCDEYMLYLSQNPDYSSAMVYSKIKSPEFYIPQKLIYSTVYYWKATAVNGGNQTVIYEGSFRTPDVPAPTVLYSNNFEDETIGSTLPTGWTQYVLPVSAPTSQVTMDTLDGNKVIKLNKNAGDMLIHPGVYYTISPAALTTGTLTVSFDVYMSPTQNVISFSLGNNGAGVGNAAGVAVSNGITSSPNTMPRHTYLYSTTTQDAGSIGYNYGNQWVKYKIVANLDNKTYNFYINGTRVGTENSSFRNPAQSINQFSVYNSSARNDYYGAYYLDNVSMTYATKPFTAPSPVSPAYLSSGVSTNTAFEWNNANASSYTLIIDENPDFSSPERIISGITTNSCTLSGAEKLDYLKRYYWKVIASNGSTTWADEAYYTFETGEDSSAGQSISLYPHLTWDSTVCDYYSLTLSKNADYSAAMFFMNIKAPEFYVPQKLSYSTDYYWKATAFSGGTQTVIREGSFRTPDAPVSAVLYNNGFERETLDSTLPLPLGWTQYVLPAGAPTSQVTVDTLDGNKVIKLNKNAGDTLIHPGVYYTISPAALTTGTLTVSFDVYMSPTQNVISFSLGNNGAGVGNAAGVAVSNGITSSPNIMPRHTYLYSTTTQDAGSIGYNYGNQWVKYKIVADLDNKTYNFYINGTRVGTPDSPFRNPAQSINQFSVYNSSARNDYYGAYYLDNVSIAYDSQFVRPSPVSPANLTSSVSTSVYFQWSNANASSYTLIIDENPDFSSPERIISGITSNSYTLSGAEKLDYLKRYYWKVVASNSYTTWADDTVPSFVTEKDPSAVENTVISEVTPQTVAPDETVTLMGQHFDESSIKMYRLPDTDFTQIGSMIGTCLDESSLTVTPTVDVPVIGRTADSLSGTIPYDEQYGTYALWASSTSGLSNPVIVNKTDLYFVYPDIVNVAVDREVRAIGQNLTYNNGSLPADAHVFLRNAQGGTYYPISSYKLVSQYDIRFDIPENIPAGSYEVWVNNGHGGAYGWGKIQNISIINQAPSSNVYVITDYGAVPDDQTVDSTAIESAVNAAATSGGGTVLVPDGQYIIDRTIFLPQGVLLEGNGKDGVGNWLSSIKFIDGAPIGQTSGGVGPQIINITGSNTGVRDLSIVGSVSVDRGITLASGVSDVIIQNNYIDNWYPTTGIKGYFGGVWGSSKEGNKRILIDNNTFSVGNAISFDGLSLSKISNNNIFCRHWSAMGFTASYTNIIEGNRIDGRNLNGLRDASRGVTFNMSRDESGWNPSEMNYLTGNDIEYVGSEVVPTNDGEYLLFDCNGDKDFTKIMQYGSLDAATSNTATVYGANWTQDQMKNLYVLVVEGKGIGQYRKVVSNDTRTLTVDRNWNIIPDPNSKVVVTAFHMKNIIAGNTASNNKGNNFMVWGNAIGNVLDNNHVQGPGGSAVAGIDMGKTASYNPSYYNVIKNSSGVSVTVEYRDYMSPSGTGRSSVNALGNVLKSNTFGNVNLYLNRTQQTLPLMQNQIIEGNTVTAAPINIVNIAKDTLVRNNTVLVTPQYVDSGSDTVIIEPVTVP